MRTPPDQGQRSQDDERNLQRNATGQQPQAPIRRTAFDRELERRGGFTRVPHGLFEALAAADYDGWLVVEAEQDPRQAPPDEYARRGLEAVRGFVAENHC